ncbi:hypothetical protein O6H91_04G101000 [Diphasiastrum complanatum]|nr:hypothetical protein O6H91_04G101000 [Diphasiastrum complanatum]
MLYGGSKEAFDSSKDADFLLHSQTRSKDWKEKHKVLKDMMEKRMLRIASGTVLGGAKLGSFTAIFCGVQHGLAVRRNVHDTFNVVAAGAVTAAAFGLALPGSFGRRLQTALIGSVFGALACLPLGFLYTSLQRQTRKEDDKNSSGIDQGGADNDSIASILQRFKDSLSNR